MSSDSLWSYVNPDSDYPFIIKLNYNYWFTKILGIDLVILANNQSKRFAYYGPSKWEFFIDDKFQSNFNSCGYQREKSISRRLFNTAMMNIYPSGINIHPSGINKIKQNLIWKEIQEQTENLYTVIQIMKC